MLENVPSVPDFQMIRKSVTISLMIFVVLLAVAYGREQKDKLVQSKVFDSSVNRKTVVRFFYDPAANYSHKPLVFRVVEKNDALLNTAPTKEEGRIAYISLSEMHDLVQVLGKSGHVWQKSEAMEPLVPYKSLPTSDKMEILVLFSDRSVSTDVDPKTLCKFLRPLDVSLKTPRALWEFQGFRVNYGCKVRGFKVGAYPDHD